MSRVHSVFPEVSVEGGSTWIVLIVAAGSPNADSFCRKSAIAPLRSPSVKIAVLGLTNFPGLQVHPLTRSANGLRPGSFDANGNPSPTACTENVNQTTGTPVCPRFYDPASFTIAYGVGTTPPATNTEIAIFTEGDLSGAIADFRQNESAFGLPAATINTIHVEPPS